MHFFIFIFHYARESYLHYSYRIIIIVIYFILRSHYINITTDNLAK